MLLIENQGFTRAHDAAIDHLTGRADHTERHDEYVAGWPILEFHADNRAVRVCIATINLSAPPPHPQSGR